MKLVWLLTVLWLAIFAVTLTVLLPQQEPFTELYFESPGNISKTVIFRVAQPVTFENGLLGEIHYVPDGAGVPALRARLIERNSTWRDGVTRIEYELRNVVQNRSMEPRYTARPLSLSFTVVNREGENKTYPVTVFRADDADEPQVVASEEITLAHNEKRTIALELPVTSLFLTSRVTVALPTQSIYYTFVGDASGIETVEGLQ